MTFIDVLDVLKAIAKDYGSFILTAIGLVFTVVFGGAQYRKFLKHRVDDLEEKNSVAKQEIEQLKAEIAAQAENLTAVEKDRNAVSAKMARIRIAFSGGDDQNIWLGGPIIQPDGYHEQMHQSIPIML